MREVIAAVMSGLEDPREWERAIFSSVCRVATEATATVFEALDDELARTREPGLRVVNRKSRTIITRYGSPRFSRRHYVDGTGRRRVLLDEMLGLHERKQVSPDLEAVAIELAAKTSFREAADVIERLGGVRLSHQCLHRLIALAGDGIDAAEERLTRSLTEDGEMPVSRGRTLPRLFVEADGTMVSLQREGTRKAEVKQVITYEGWETAKTGGHQVKGKTVLAGLHPAGELWDRLTTQLLGEYETGVLSRLVIGGDGAGWIRKGPELFAGSRYQLCRFHLHRAFLRAGKDFAGSRRAYGIALKGDVEGALAALEPRTKEHRRSLATYLGASSHGLTDYRGHITGPVDPLLRGLGAIESNMDKNIANRMKKRGMSWSLAGAHRMAKVLQEQVNGGLGRRQWMQPEPEPTERTRKLTAAAVSLRADFETDPGEWLRARLPALTGPHSNRPWAQMLRELSETKTGAQL